MKLQLLTLFLLLPMLVIPAFAEIEITNVKLTEQNGDDIDIVNADSIIRTSITVTNIGDEEQIYVHVITTTHNDIGGSGWITGSVDSGESYTSALSSLIDTDGVYQIKTMVLDNTHLENKNLLYPTFNISFTTGLDDIIITENDFTFTPDNSTSPHNELTINVELSYSLGETITVTGNVSEISSIGIPSVILFVEDDMGSIQYIDAVPIKSDWTYEFILDASMLEEGECVFQISSGNETVEFDEPVLFIQNRIQLDKEEYHMGEIITVTVSTENFNIESGTIIYFSMYDENDYLLDYIEMSLFENTGNVIHRVYTNNNINWQQTGTIQLDVSILEYSGTTYFDYIYEPNMTNEKLYDDIQKIYEILRALTSDDIDQAKLDVIHNLTRQLTR